MVDLAADVSNMPVQDLLEYQQELTRTRLAVLDAQRRAQAELDDRARRIAERRANEDQLLGATRRAQSLFGEAEVADDEPDPYDFVEANEMLDMANDAAAEAEAGS